MTSILDDTKQVLGIHEANRDFDTDIVMAINSALFTLGQLGIGDPKGFEITDQTEDWTAIFGDRKDLNAVKSYIFVSVRLLFDRPESSYGVQALEKMRDEWTWRLEYQSRNESTQP